MPGATQPTRHHRGQPRYVPYYSRTIALGDFPTIDLSMGYTYQHSSLLAKRSRSTNRLRYLVHDRYRINPVAPCTLLASLSFRPSAALRPRSRLQV